MWRSCPTPCNPICVTIFHHVTRFSNLTRSWCLTSNPAFFSVLLGQEKLLLDWDKLQCRSGTFLQLLALFLPKMLTGVFLLFLCVPLQALSCCTSQKWWGFTYLCWRRARTTIPWRQLPGLCKISVLDSGWWVQSKQTVLSDSLCTCYNSTLLLFYIFAAFL